MAYQVRNIAPFINKEFTITSKWWNERVNPITGETEIHRGLDISTGANDNVYSILAGNIHSFGTDSSMGNWVIIHDTITGYASLYMHLKDPINYNVGDLVSKGQVIGVEGSTGDSTGIHLHVEMQDISRFNNQWHWSYNKSDYLDPTVYMGIDNIEGTTWIYNYNPSPTPTRKKSNFKFYLFKKRKLF